MRSVFKIAALIVAALALFSLFGCAGQGGEEATETEENASLPASELPTVSVTTASGVPVRQREYEAVTVTVSGSAGGEFDFENATAQMKCRGNSTFHLPKKPYRIKFDEKVNLLGQGAGPSKSWVLLANYNDQSMLRNHVSFAMGKKLDRIGFTSSSSFVHLYENGVYRGVYELVEHHGEGKYRIVMKEDPEEPDTDYLIEMDDYTVMKGFEFPTGFETGDRGYEIHSDTMTSSKWLFIYHFIRDVDAAAEEGDRDTVEAMLDIPSFIDMYLLEEISKDPDAGISSFFYLKKAGGKLYCTCPWDFDIAYGNDPTVDDGSPTGLFAGDPTREKMIEGGFAPHPWISALMRRQWFCDLVKERWDEMKGTLEETAYGAIDEVVNGYADEMRKNFDAWALTGDADKWEEYAGELREWIAARFEFLDGWFSNPETLYKYVE